MAMFDFLNNYGSTPVGTDSLGNAITQAEALGGTPANYNTGINNQSFTGQVANGWNGMSGLQQIGTVANTALGFFNAYQSYQAAKDQRKYMQEQSALARTNLANNVRLTNASLADRQQARLDANPNNMSVADYMAKYGATT